MIPGKDIVFFLTHWFRLALGPKHSAIQRVLGILSVGVKQPGCEADCSPPYYLPSKKTFLLKTRFGKVQNLKKKCCSVAVLYTTELQA
jgi:hypothetical protein